MMKVRKGAHLLMPFTVTILFAVFIAGLVRNDLAAATTFNVNSTDDSIDVQPGDGICETTLGGGDCTLRAAIMEANALAGHDIVEIPAGVYTLTLQGNDDTTLLGDLDIRDDIDIVGAGSEATIIDATLANDRIFDATCADPYPIANNNNALQEPTTCPDSLIVNIHDVQLTGGGTHAHGSAVRADYGLLSLRRVLVDHNRDTAIAAHRLVLEDSTVSNTSIGSGVDVSLEATISGSTIRDNEEEGIEVGPACHNGNGIIIVSDSIIANNHTGIDGDCRLHLDHITLESNDRAIRVFAPINLLNSKIISNTGFHLNSSANGVYIGSLIENNEFLFNSESTSMSGLIRAYRNTFAYNSDLIQLGLEALQSLDLQSHAANNTFSHNEYIVFEDPVTSEITLEFNTFANNSMPITLRINSGGDVRLLGNIFSENGDHNCVVIGESSLFSLGFNIATDSSCLTTHPSDLVSMDILLGPLQNNGGETLSHLLLPGSPAIDYADSICPATDQRGLFRPADGDGQGGAICDVGSVEINAQPPLQLFAPAAIGD